MRIYIDLVRMISDRVFEQNVSFMIDIDRRQNTRTRLSIVRSQFIPLQRCRFYWGIIYNYRM